MTQHEAIEILAQIYDNGKIPLNADPAFKMAIKAIKKQIPMKPDYIADGYADGLLCYDYAKCPICGHDFEYGINDWEAEYCSDCGQRLDWSE